MKLTSEQLQELKEIELDIFREFIRVCEKLNLKYYLLGGTLLGAVRHQGFIPWDDDIDVGMLREDYEIFLEKGQALLPSNLFLQNIYTDPECPYNFSKIRNSNTTFVESSINKFKINHGVYIDVFPLDHYPDESSKQKQLYRKMKLCTYRIGLEFNLPHKTTLKHRIASKLIKIKYPSLKQALNAREQLYKAVSSGTYIANFGGAWGKKEIVPAEWYGKGVTLEFEGIKVMAPQEYDKWLTQVYGDYMKLPPLEKRVGHHYVDVIDLKKSYLEYRVEKE